MAASQLAAYTTELNWPGRSREDLERVMELIQEGFTSGQITSAEYTTLDTLYQSRIGSPYTGTPATPTTPPTGGATVATYMAQLQATTDRTALEAIHTAFGAAYSAGTLTRAEYDSLYSVYSSRVTGRPYVPPAIGPTQTPTQGMAAWPTGEFEAAYPQQAWNQAYGLPAYGRNPFQQMMAGQAAPAYASWLGGQLIPGASPQGFTPAGYGAGATGQAALAALRQAVGLGAPEQERWQQELGAEGDIASLSALLRGALGQGGRGYAAPIANIMAARAPSLQGAWTGETGAGATGPTFLQYLMQKYNL